MASMAFIKAICCISNENVMDVNEYMNCVCNEITKSNTCIQRKLLSCSRRLPTNNALGNQNEILIIDDDDGRKVDTNST